MWTLTARIWISDEDRENAGNPQHESTFDEQADDIQEGLRSIALLYPDMLGLFDWVESDLSAGYIGVISGQEPPLEVVILLHSVSESLGNVQLDENQIAYALFIAKKP